MSTDPLLAWRASLAHILPELHASLGQLLLRLHPLVGSMRTAFVLRDEVPQGVGSVQQRGAYERLLISEWAYADAAPDEFIRRAANNELLFLGPEPEKQQSSNLSIALFDCGPAQLGQPRLAHFALLIILARRAQEAKAEFKWGSLQNPRILHDFSFENSQAARNNLQELIGAHSLQAVNQEMLSQWQDALAEHGKNVRDCWQIGASYGASLPQASARVKIEHDLLAKNGQEYLQVRLQQGHSSREIELILPDERTAVRLLRDPFVPIAKPQFEHTSQQSLDFAAVPLWSSCGRWLALKHINSSYQLHHVPNSLKDVVSKVRTLTVPTEKADCETLQWLAKKMVGKNLAYVLQIKPPANHNDAENTAYIRIGGFHGLLNEDQVIRFPSAPAFIHDTAQHGLLECAVHSGGGKDRARLFLINQEKRLLCFDIKKNRMSSPKRIIADEVFGMLQVKDKLIYLEKKDDCLRLWQWEDHRDEARLLLTFDSRNFNRASSVDDVKKVLFGALRNWQQSFGLLAIQFGRQHWLVGMPNDLLSIALDGLAHIEIARKCKVLAPVSAKQLAGLTHLDEFGLLIVSENRRVIQFQSSKGIHTVLESANPIRQAAFETNTGFLAYLTEFPQRLVVTKLSSKQELMRIDFQKTLTKVQDASATL